MKSVITFLLLSIISISCSASKKASFEPNSIEAFVAKIEQAANTQDYDAMIPLLDEVFYEEQLNEIHEGDKVGFANEFFCGDYEGKYKCIVFQDIKSVKKKSITKTESGGYTVVFEVTNNNGEMILTRNVWIKTILINGKPIYRMYGPAG